MSNESFVNFHPLFGLIQKEHQLIQKKISEIPSTANKKEILPWLWNVVENQHHLQEENLIFKTMLNSKVIHEGGPFCVLYFDQHILNRPSDRVKKMIGASLLQLESQNVFFQNQSPLDIPLEEHRSMRTLLDYLIKNTSSLPEDSFLKIFQSYLDLYKLHTQKEESCFFHVASKALTTTELDNILSSWKPIEF